jgi:Flp pilus assembly protein TadG
LTAQRSRILSLLDRFVDDERGSALILVTVMLPVLVGFSLLAIDMSRVNNLHNDLQKAADAFALEAAAELDGRDDAHERADRALAYLVQNDSRFSDDGTHTLTYSTAEGVTSDITRHFLDDLPENDADPITSVYWSDDRPEDSRFIEVTVTPTGFSSIFPASFLGGADNFNVGGSAVAGFAGVVTCDMTPIFICNPFPENDLGFIVSNYNFYRAGIKLVPGSSTAGNFGFLRPQSEHGYGEQELASDLARSHVRECVNTEGIFTQTGTLTVAATNAINTRFDMGYSQGAQGFNTTDSTVAPAPNIRKGYAYVQQGNQAPDACNMEPGEDPALFMGMPRDTAHINNTEPSLIADGFWDYEAYVAVNNLDVSDFLDEEGGAYSNANPPSRYDLYMYEIASGQVNTPSDGLETGTPACHSSVAGPERRLIYAAIVDCDEFEDELQGQSGTAQAIGFASFFLTEPSNGSDVYAEIVDIDGRRGRGTMIDFARDNVQLYR